MISEGEGLMKAQCDGVIVYGIYGDMMSNIYQIFICTLFLDCRMFTSVTPSDICMTASSLFCVELPRE